MQDFRRLLKYLRPHWVTFALAMLAMILVAVFETATGALIVPIFDQAFGTSNAQKTSTLFNLQNLIPADDWFAGVGDDFRFAGWLYDFGRRRRIFLRLT